MTRFYLGFSDSDAAYRLSGQLSEQLSELLSEQFVNLGDPGTIRFSRPFRPFRRHQTNEYLVSVKVESDEASQLVANLVANSGGRILTEEEYEALNAFSRGDRDGRIAPFQMKLLNKDYFQRIPDGEFDLEMEQAVKDFQRDEGLEATGILDEETMNRLMDDKLFDS